MWPWLKRLLGDDPGPSKAADPAPVVVDPAEVNAARQRALVAIQVPYEKAQAESQDRFWNDGQRGNVKRFSAKAFSSAKNTLEQEAPAPGDTPRATLPAWGRSSATSAAPVPTSTKRPGTTAPSTRLP